MKHSVLALGAAAVVMLANCRNEGTAESVTPTHVDLASSPGTPYVGEPVTFTVTAHNDQRAIESVALDYTDDGTIDETQTCDARAVALSFTTTYPTAGTYDVRAVATDASGEDTSRSKQVSVVIPPPLVPVSLTVDGSSPQGGRCFALGPPVTCPDCAVLVGTSAPAPLTVSMGQHYRGSQIRIDQVFNQWPVAFNDMLYQCTFHLVLVAGEPGHERGINTGSCSTSSLTRPVQLNCSVSLAGDVP